MQFFIGSVILRSTGPARLNHSTGLVLIRNSPLIELFHSIIYKINLKVKLKALLISQSIF